MRTYKSLLGSIGGSIVITLITGLYHNMALIGATWYGFPLGWLIKRVLAPGYFPWHVSITNLIVDLVIWFVIIEVVYLAAKSLETKEEAPVPRKRRRR